LEEYTEVQSSREHEEEGFHLKWNQVVGLEKTTQTTEVAQAVTEVSKHW
jgi:hypothetical protein